MRTHNVRETRDAVRVGEALRLCLGRDPLECSQELRGLVQGASVGAHH